MSTIACSFLVLNWCYNPHLDWFFPCFFCNGASSNCSILSLFFFTSEVCTSSIFSIFLNLVLAGKGPALKWSLLGYTSACKRTVTVVFWKKILAHWLLMQLKIKNVRYNLKEKFSFLEITVSNGEQGLLNLSLLRHCCKLDHETYGHLLKHTYI